MPSSLSDERRGEIDLVLERIVSDAGAALRSDGEAIDVAQHAVEALEDCPFFNAGIGAVLTREGTHELEASIMDGDSGRAGAVCGLVSVRRPIRLARAVMERTDHIFIGGTAAEALAAEWGLEQVDNAVFTTPHRRAQLDAWLASRSPEDTQHHATVGAVVCDVRGRLAAATSTGGMTGKMPGRIGDTPVIGAGIWADRQVAVSGTGQGEMFILASAARMVAARMALLGESVAQASQGVLDDMPPRAGGVIAVDAAGNVALPFTSAGMHRAWLTQAMEG